MQVDIHGVPSSDYLEAFRTVGEEDYDAVVIVMGLPIPEIGIPFVEGVLNNPMIRQHMADGHADASAGADSTPADPDLDLKLDFSGPIRELGLERRIVSPTHVPDPRDYVDDPPD
jgi:hypothetical protein